MRYPLMLLTFAMTPAIQPVIRKHSDNKEMVEVIHRNFTFKLSVIGAVAGFGIFLLAEKIVIFMLGAQWVDVIPIVKVLAIAIPVQVVLSTSGSFFQAMNRTDLLFLSGLLSSIIMVAAIVWGVLQRDMVKLSWALVAALHINFFQAYYIMYSRVFGKKLFQFLYRMVPASLIILTMLTWY
ncbi:Lipopolysaccharide biosynthesis protein WzxC [compost metagenome]